MATISCIYSGIEFTCQHFPLAMRSNHPIFELPQKKLLGFTPKYFGAELTPTDSYLLFLALLNSTSKVEFRVPAFRTTFTNALIANNMENLIHVIGAINIIQHPGFSVPSFVISPDTKDLANISNWIANWEACIQDFKDGYRTYNESRALLNREVALEKLIKNSSKSISSYAHILADWAEIAGSFPVFEVRTPDNELISCAKYWKQIIAKCVRDEAIFAIPSADLEELIEHCEVEITHGSIHAHTLMDLLRTGKKKQVNYLGLGDITLLNSPYKILENDSDVERQNKLILIESAPTELPILSAYPSKLAYMRAMVKYNMAKEYAESQAQESLNKGVL